MKIPIGVSKRHVHLTKESLIKLFGFDDLKVRNYINQPGEFASTITVELKSDHNTIEKVRVVGPIRGYDQVEVTRSDANLLGLNPPTRKSGDIKGSAPITLIGPSGEVSLNEGTIIAQRHVHLGKELAQELDLENDEVVIAYKDNKKLFDAVIKVKNPSYEELHIDIEESNIYNLEHGEEVEIYKCGK